MHTIKDFVAVQSHYQCMAIDSQVLDEPKGCTLNLDVLTSGLDFINHWIISMQSIVIISSVAQCLSSSMYFYSIDEDLRMISAHFETFKLSYL